MQFGRSRAVYDAPSVNRAAQESPVSGSPTSTSDPAQLIAAGASAAAKSRDLDAALVALVEIARAGTGASRASIYLQDPDRPSLELAASSGTEAGGDEEDARAADRAVNAERVTEPSLIAVPVSVATNGVETYLGALVLRFAGEAPAPAGIGTFLEAIADLIAVAVDRDRLGSTAAERSEWFERMAHTDPLTGLANERTVGRILELELARAARQATEVSLAIFDIDDFRATNRDGGHPAGDDVLRRVAAVLAGSVRLVDTVGRIGGDEFVVVAPGSAGATVTRRILEGIEGLPPVVDRPITVSAGVARFPGDGSDADALIASASAALEAARAAGRGTVSFSSSASDA
jgi:diguanylate cyclase (GGDEF)-like protein